MAVVENITDESIDNEVISQQEPVSTDPNLVSSAYE
jgi:hypothetical protein